MEREEVDVKTNIKEESYWLENPKPFNHQPGKLTKTSEDCPLSCDVLDSKLLVEVKFENTQSFDEVTASKDVDPLRIEAKDEDKKCLHIFPIATRDEEDSDEKPLDVKGSAGNIRSPRLDMETALSSCRYALLFIYVLFVILC